MASIDQLHSEYCDFVDRQRRDPVTDFPVDVPAFFIADPLSLRDWFATPEANAPVKLPFEQFMIVLRFSDGSLKTKGKIATVIHAISADRLVEIAGVPEINHWFVGADAAPDQAPRALVAYSQGMINYITQAIHEPDEPETLTRINRGRAKSKHGLAPIPKFITIRPRTVSDSPVEHRGGGGWTMPPHNRRGHWRTRKATGKRFWVRDYAVHGGADVGRHYRVSS